MKFLLDENIPNKYKDILEKVYQIPKFFKLAYNQKRIIITIDKDFYQYKKVDNFGIISIGGNLLNPMNVLINTLKQIEKD